MSKLTKRHFWEWFKRNNKEYLDLENKNKKEAFYWVNELTAHLRAYFKFLKFNLALHDEQEAKLTITVHGKAAHFKKVDALVAAAPVIPGWTIIALEEPVPMNCFLEDQLEKAGIEPDELLFSFTNVYMNMIDIIIYHPLITPQNLQLFYKIAYAAVYNLLGERSFGTDVHIAEVANLSEADEGELLTLEELPAVVGLFRSSMVVDENGVLSGGG